MKKNFLKSYLILKNFNKGIKIPKIKKLIYNDNKI